MSVPYGRYVISYDKAEKAWNADPKARSVLVHGQRMNYTFPESVAYVSETIEGLANAIQKEGGRITHRRRLEWVVHCNGNSAAEAPTGKK